MFPEPFLEQLFLMSSLFWAHVLHLSDVAFVDIIDQMEDYNRGYPTEYI